jgi:VWFA-related protein
VLVVSFLLLQPAGSSAIPQHHARHPATPQQQNPTQKPTARSGGFSAAVEMVRVPVVVEDEDGSFIRNLDKSAFTVQDGGTSHAVDHFVSDAEPATVGIVVDASAAMAPFTDEVRGAVMRVVNNLRLDDELFLICYGVTAKSLSPRSQDKFAFAMALAGYAPKGTDRALFDAIELGMSTLQDATYDKRSLILVGVGGDTSSHVGEATLQQDIRRAGVSIHAIVLADRVARGRGAAARVNRAQTIPEIVRFTGGMLAQRPPNAEHFGGVSGWLRAAGTDISTYVKHQYLLHYVPMNPPRPGTWRSISVRLDIDYEKVRARSGYIR